MPGVLDLLHDHEKRHFGPADTILEQGQNTGLLFFLIEGTVEVVKDDVQVATTSRSGATFGELSVLLGIDHTATVRALKPCQFYVVENPRALLETSPPICLHVCELVARRLDAMNRYLVDVQQQLAGHDHLGMVDGVLSALLHRQPSKRTRPSESTIRHGEVAD